MRSILVVEDNLEYQLLLKGILSSQELSLTFSEKGSQALSELAKNPFDMVLLDVSLPDTDGFSVLSDIRRSNLRSGVPIILLTSRDAIPDKVAAFSLGADDYIVKSVSPIELKAKIEAKLRNRGEHEGGTFTPRNSGLELDVSGHRAFAVTEGRLINLGLTPLEFRLLHFLARHEGRTFSRDQILLGIWGREVNVGDRTVDTHISALRKKLGEKGNLIEAIPTVGYRYSVR